MITFGRFGKVLAIEEEKEKFLYKLNELFCGLGDKYIITSYKEKEILKPLKELLKTEILEESVPIKIEWLSYFLQSMYLSYYTLDSKEQKEILDMDYTYDNWKIKSLELMKSFIERTKKILPQLYISAWMIFILFYICENIMAKILNMIISLFIFEIILF